MPSDEAYAPAVETLERARVQLAHCGVSRADDFDLYTAMVGGLIDAQQANDPGGDRWSVLLDQAMDMFADHVGLPGIQKEITMTQADPTTPTVVRPRTSTLDRATLMRLAATEYGRFASLLSELPPDDWGRPTECPGWDVRAMVGHVLGMAEMVASIREGRRQQKAAGGAAASFLDALTALQVDERRSMSGPQS